MIKTSITRNSKQLTIMVKKGQFSFDNVIQRGLVWNKGQKSNLIHSLIEDYPVPAVYARRINKIYDVLDGKQRINTIVAFMNDEFALSKIPPVTYEPYATEENNTDTQIDNAINKSADSNSITVDITGKRYSQLPTELQDKIDCYGIEINCFEDITDEQIKILFMKLNNGKPLSSKDKNIANCPNIDTISEIGEHDVFYAILKDKAREHRKQIPIVMKIWSMLYSENVSFESRVFNNLIKTIIVTPEQQNEINSILNKALDVFNKLDAKELRKKFSTETHFVSFISIIKSAMDSNIDTDTVANFFSFFFGSENDASISVAYNDASKSGAAKASSITTRKQELENAWTEFIASNSSELS